MEIFLLNQSGHRKTGQFLLKDEKEKKRTVENSTESES